jgi:hypothetical protein
MSQKVGSGGAEASNMRWVSTVVQCGCRAAATDKSQKGTDHPPKDEVRVGHKVRYALEHAPRLQHERRECDLGEVHADSGGGVRHDDGQWVVRTGGRRMGRLGRGAHLSCEMSDRMIEPSSSSL